MEEVIALEPEATKKFKKTVSGIKRLLKNKSIEPPLEEEPMEKGKKLSKKSQLKQDRGVVYIGHIPHGFYENEMRGFFSQFGKVSNVRVARSAKNGRSKGYAFVEFEDREVAEIVSETMNNYLMDKRLLKAELIPADREMGNIFKGKNWIENKVCPGIKNRNRAVRNFNKPISDESWIEESKKHINKIYKMKSKLQSLGIDFDFTPSDIPEELKDYDPSNPNKNFIKIATTDSSASSSDELAESTDEELDESIEVKSKKSNKEKSMKKPFSLLLKPPKARKAVKNEHIGVLAPKNTKKSNKIVTNIMQSKAKDRQAKKEHKINKNVDEKLHMRKETGGIQKKRGKLPLSKSVISKEKMTNQISELLDSSLVKTVKKTKTVINKNIKKRK